MTIILNITFRCVFPLIILLTLFSCKKQRDVKYTVTCDSCEVMYLNAKREMMHQTVTSSWTTQFEGNRAYSLYLSATNTEGIGAIAVHIHCSGRLISEDSNSGELAIATAEGNIPI